MIIHRDIQQGSDAWLKLRCGIPTASELDSLISPTWQVRTGQGPATYLATKLAEAWAGPLAGFGSWATDQGQLLEQQARDGYEFQYDTVVERVGFITTDDRRFGCSPDGLLNEDKVGLEIKCLQPIHQVSCLLAGDCPKDFSAQVHGSMYATGLYEWRLFLYSRKFPCLHLVVKRDEEIQDKIHEALEGFYVRFDRAMARMIELNGGEGPPKPEPPKERGDPSALHYTRSETAMPSWHDPDDVIP